MDAFHVSRIGVSSQFGGDTFTIKAHFHSREHAETARRVLQKQPLPPGPFPAQFAEQAETIETAKLAQALSWLGLSAPSGEMLSWWVGREVNRVLDAVLEQREAMRGWQPIATAPKDGTEFLAWFQKHRINDDGDSTDEVVGGAQAIIAFTEANGWDEPQWLDANGAYYMDDWCFAEEPVLWRPLPPPPEAIQEAMRGKTLA